MEETQSGLKKVISVAGLFFIFIVVALGMIFGVNVLTHFMKTGELSYKVTPVNTIIKLINREDKNEDLTVQTTDNGTSTGNLGNTATGGEVSYQKDNSLAQLVENVMPSIVSIDCKIENYSTDLFFEYYGGGTTTSKSSGSGIIIAQNSTEILIVTNNHVVEGASEVYVSFINDEQCVAQIKGTDEACDLAVLSVKGSDISDSSLKAIRIATLGDSDKLSVGDIAIAIGNSMGYGLSVTKGVISALDRTINSEDYSMPLIQSDAAINPGNSGGALLNSRGEVIGINSVKFVSDTTESIGYAIPIVDAVPIINELINFEEIDEDEQAYLGIVADTISDAMASYFNCSRGVYVKSVSEESPAQEAGILMGDVITSIAGRKVTSMEEVANILRIKRGGTQAEVVYERLEEGKYVEHTTTVTFGNKGDYDD